MLPSLPLSDSRVAHRPGVAGQLLRQLRVAHWVKNAALLLPAFFGGGLFQLGRGQYGPLAAAVGAFCLMGSAVYALNDVLDVAHDRRHHTKRLRPYASGFFSRRQVAGLGLACLVGGLACTAALPAAAALLPLAYLLLNVLYCFWLKHWPLVDVSCISLGFLLRLAAGGLATGTPLSHWIVITTFLLMFSVALAKRRDDLVLAEGQPASPDSVFRPAQVGYTKQFIDTAKAVSFAVTLVAYLLYTLSPEVMTRLGSPYVYVTALPVFLGIMRYLQLSIVQQVTGSPVRLVLREPFLLLMGGVWLGLFYWLLYVG
jgi:decaprenyl-phosphate phosphoribosyltransferase